MSDRFCKNLTATWTAIDTSIWSATDGGSGGASVPGISDNAFFTAITGAANITLGYNASVLFNDFTGYTGTFSLGANTFACTKWTAVTGMTLSAASSTITITGSNTFTTGGKTYGTVNLSTTANLTISGASATFANLSLKNTLNYINFTVPNMTVTGTLEMMGSNISTQRIRCGSQSYFAASTITLNGTSALTNVDLIGVVAAGSMALTGTSLGDGGNNSGNITFTTPKTPYWVQGASASVDYISGANFSLSSGGAVSSNNFPLPQDTLLFDANSFTASGKTVACAQTGVLFPAIDFTGALNSPTFSPATPTFMGSLTLISGMTFSPTGNVNLRSRSTNNTLTSAGKSFGAVTFMYRTGVSLTLQDDFASTGVFTYQIGTFNLNNFNAQSTTISSNGGSIRTLTLGSGTWTLTGSGTVMDFNGASNVTVTATTGTIKLTDSSASSKTVYGIGKTWGNFWNATGSTGVVIMADSATWNDFKIDAGRTQQFTAATTTTFKSLTATGTLGNLITIQSPTSATHTLTHTPTSLATRFVSCDYLALDHSIASPANSFYAGANSTDNGSNTGWIFTAAPTENIKTRNGIPLSSIKNSNGIPAGVTKSFNGII